MACRVWSLPDGVNFTGTCTMVMLAETANITTKCVLCVHPVEPDELPVPSVRMLTGECKTWTVLASLYTPLCAMNFMPDVGSKTCAICVSPVSPDAP